MGPDHAGRPDLQDRADIERLVRTFYLTVFDDPLIGPIFTDVAHMDLDHHLPIMCDFWQTVLFRAGLYRRNALALHVALDAKHALTEADFARWLEIWATTVDALFAGEKAELAKVQAERIAGSIHRRLQGRSGSEFETIGLREGLRPGAEAAAE
ncbi:MAG: group III truncated hemoglobin [Microbacteriaceae bacterium]|nr:group III truncated hemoglobin [Microbacteriaceae bacterium]MCL2794733.1 group III truncated hemoglobin [Microbacteriaceae bacterium]